jgi:hypothetical protein
MPYEKLEAQETRVVELPSPCAGWRVTVRRITVHAGRRIAMYLDRVRARQGDILRAYIQALVSGVPDRDIATPPVVVDFSGYDPPALRDLADLDDVPPTWQEQLIELLLAVPSAQDAVVRALEELREEWEKKKFGSQGSRADS